MGQCNHEPCPLCGSQLGKSDVEEGTYVFCPFCKGILIFSENALMRPHSDVPDEVLEAHRELVSQGPTSYDDLQRVWARINRKDWAS